MSTYCKAYSLSKLRQYPGWTEKSENARKEMKPVDGKEVEVIRKLTDNDYLYLHDSYIVTDGILEDKNVIFDDVTPEWQKFCQEVLNFEIPKLKKAEIKNE
ncbi:MAG: hypothetical protein ONB16_08965 [candidate division KSB1 bacterium]|nr:hypothetical protein [candidate division KSB1 bacterium]MDZ7319896.1 hypothetical protein [candidate division KSB1 bacterium]MDZ7341142.1 hypothetical protein [candidate division KSB1 bacterium]